MSLEALKEHGEVRSKGYILAPFKGNTRGGGNRAFEGHFGQFWPILVYFVIKLPGAPWAPFKGIAPKAPLRGI